MEKDEQRGVGSATARAFVLGSLLSGFFAWVVVMRDNADPGGDPNTYLAANLSPVLPYVMLLLAGVLINPLLRRLKVIRLLSKAELLLIFVMCFVSGGIATFGLSGKLVPTVAALSNKAWNTDQKQWDLGSAPFLRDSYFIVAKGSQAKAKELRAAHLEYEKARIIYQTARDLKLGEAELARIEADSKEVSAIENAELREAREKAMVWPYAQATKLVERATAKWAEVGGDLDPQQVVATYGDKVADLKSRRDALRTELKEMNSEMYAAVEEVRKGLPEEMRAMPGFFYGKGEGWASYKARIKRLKEGSESRKELEKAAAILAAKIASGDTLPGQWAQKVRSASEGLEPISDIPTLSALDTKLSEELSSLEEKIAMQEAETRQLRHLRRYSKQNQFELFNDQIAEVEAETEDLEAEAKELRHRVEVQVRPQLTVCERVKTTRAELAAIAESVPAIDRADYPELQERLDASLAAYTTFDATARRFWLGDARWGLWVGPITNWLVLVFLTYLVLMTFNTLIFRQWAHHEKLIYPLAEVTSLVAGGREPDEHGKTLFRSGLFWFGFCLAVGVLGWNYLATSKILTNISPIKLETAWWGFVGGGVFRGLSATYFCIIFVVIGISFLIPANISFSLWFFEVLFMGLTMVLVWLGYGYNRQSFHPVRSGLGAGAMLVFGIATLWTCRRYLLCAFTPGVLKGLERDEARELRWSSGLFVGGVCVLVLLLTLVLGANLFWVIIFFLVAMTIAVALIRAVAEGGVLGIENSAGVFMILKTVFGMTHAWCAPLLLAPVTVFSGFFFGGSKAFIAPMMANSLKIREEIKMRRIHFHGAVAVAIFIATLVSVAALILISYDRGADNLHGWLNTASARGAIDGVRGWVRNVGPVNVTTRKWLIIGAVLMVSLLFGRRRIFGIPHPLGLLMLMNFSMYGFWASIMIGWLFKHLVSKYCSHRQYVSIRRFFIGLVLGHLVAILFGWDYMEFHWG